MTILAEGPAEQNAAQSSLQEIEEDEATLASEAAWEAEERAALEALEDNRPPREVETMNFAAQSVVRQFIQRRREQWRASSGEGKSPILPE